MIKWRIKWLYMRDHQIGNFILQNYIVKALVNLYTAEQRWN